MALLSPHFHARPPDRLTHAILSSSALIMVPPSSHSPALYHALSLFCCSVLSGPSSSSDAKPPTTHIPVPFQGSLVPSVHLDVLLPLP